MFLWKTDTSIVSRWVSYSCEIVFHITYVTFFIKSRLISWLYLKVTVLYSRCSCPLTFIQMKNNIFCFTQGTMWQSFYPEFHPWSHKVQKKNLPDISNKICFWKFVLLQKYFSNDTIKRKYTQTSITDRKWNSDKNSAFYHFGRWVRSSFSGCLISLKGKDKNNSIFCDQ